MAITEVPQSQIRTGNYARCGVMFVTYPNGSTYSGSCAVVGENDIITAGHMVYNPDRGGYATNFEFYFGADYNTRNDSFDSYSFSYSLTSGFTWTIKAWPTNVFVDSNNTTLNLSEAQYDVALIGVSVPFGNTTGWFGLDWGRDYSQYVNQVGYPGTGTGMMTSYSYVTKIPGYGVYEMATDNMGAGSSGGPLFTNDGYLIGVKNSGDVLVAKEVVDVLGIKDKHRTILLEDISYEEVLRNFYSADLFLPMQRILYPNLSDLYSKGTVVSGLYGDVVFEDNPKNEKFVSYNEYLKVNNIKVISDVDFLVAKAYDALPNWEKLYRIILRSQKLTKQGVVMNNKNLKCFIPFLDKDLVSIACQIKEENVYSKLVKNIMKDELVKIIHQSSLSYFCHNKLVRKFERLYYKKINRKYCTPYFDMSYLESIGINSKENFIPVIPKL